MNRWLVLEVARSADDRDDRVAALLALGGSAVEEDGDILRTWVPEPADLPAFLIRARQALGAEPAWSHAEDRDWLAEWRRGLDARRVGDHFVVTPTWIEPDRRAGDIVIAIEPQMAFGTGEHATTRLMLALLEGRVSHGARVLDVGTGSGILAIAADHLGAGAVDAVESDADALPNAAENVERNGAARVRLIHDRVDADWLALHGPWHVILANVLSSVLEPLLEAFRRSIEPGGAILLGGILRDEAARLREAAGQAGLTLVEERAEDEWWSVVLSPRP